MTAELSAGPVEAFIDADQITQVLHNSLQNARDAAREARGELLRDCQVHVFLTQSANPSGTGVAASMSWIDHHGLDPPQLRGQSAIRILAGVAPLAENVDDELSTTNTSDTMVYVSLIGTYI